MGSSRASIPLVHLEAILKKLFAVDRQRPGGSVALLVLRLIVGVAFTIIGYGKIQNPTGWMGPTPPIPGALLALAAIAEFGGGISLLLGLLTRLGALGLLITMIVAASFHIFVAGDPFINPTGGGSWQLAAVYAGVSLLYLALGPGRFSLDRLIFGER